MRPMCARAVPKSGYPIRRGLLEKGKPMGSNLPILLGHEGAPSDSGLLPAEPCSRPLMSTTLDAC